MMDGMNEEEEECTPLLEPPEVSDPPSDDVSVQEPRLKCRVFLSQMCKEHGEQPRNFDIQELPNCDNPDEYYHDVEAAMRGIIRVVCIPILYVYDCQCEYLNDKTDGILLKLIKNLEYEEQLEMPLRLGPDGTSTSRMIYDEETINRLQTLRFRYPVYNRLFETLRLLDMTLEQWCAVRGVFGNGDYGFHYLPVAGPENETITMRFQRIAEEYADHFFTGLLMYSSWKTILVNLAVCAGEIASATPAESAEQTNNNDTTMQQDGPTKDDDGGGDLHMIAAPNADDVLNQNMSGEEFARGDQGFPSDGQNPTEDGFWSVPADAETMTGTEMADENSPYCRPE